jgi:hypothetical protein
MYVRPEYIRCTAVMSILHVRSSCVSYMYIRSEYVTCASVLSILHVRPC